MQYQTYIMPIWTKSPQGTETVAILLFDGFSNLCLANCVEPMRAANDLLGRRAYEWSLFSVSGEPVRSSSDLPILPAGPAKALARSEALFVIAGYGHLTQDTAEARRALGVASRKAQVIAGLDTGPWLLASAGLLQGRKATVHWDEFDSFSERFHRVEAQKARVVQDGNRITCAGALSTLDLMLDLIRARHGQALALDVEELFLRSDPTRDTPDLMPGDPLVRRALTLMRDTIESPLPLPQLAARMGLPAKTLERRFHAALGAPPGQVYRHLRLSAAHRLVKSTTLSVAEVALRCGYENPSALTRAYRSRFGISPRISRRSA